MNFSSAQFESNVMPNRVEGQSADFVHLWTSHARGLYAYIMTMTFDVHLADDIMQETAATAWKQFEEFAPGSNFRAWTARIASHKAMHALEKRRPLLEADFDLQLLNLLGDVSLAASSELDRQFEFLSQCLQDLNPRDRELLQRRYGRDEEVSQIAQRVNRSASTVYKSLERIHDWLFHCVSRKLRKEAVS